MRFRYSKAKSEKLQQNPKRGIGFEEAGEIFARPYYLDKRSTILNSIARLVGQRVDCTRSSSKSAKTNSASTITW